MAGVRWRVETCISAVDRAGRSYASREVCVEAGSWSAFHQRNMHIVIANFYLLSVTGPKMPPDLKDDAERAVTSKAELIDWLKRSLDAVKQAHLEENQKD